MNHKQVKQLKLISFDVFDGLRLCMGDAPPAVQFAYLLPFADMWFKHRNAWSKGHFTVVGYEKPHTFLVRVGGDGSNAPPAATSPPLDGTLISLSEDELQKQVALPANVARAASRKASTATALRQELHSVFAKANLLYSSHGSDTASVVKGGSAAGAAATPDQDDGGDSKGAPSQQAGRKAARLAQERADAAAAAVAAAARRKARKGPPPAKTVHKRNQSLRLVKEVPVPPCVGLKGRYVWQLLQLPGTSASVLDAAEDDKTAHTLLPPSDQMVSPTGPVDSPTCSSASGGVPNVKEAAAAGGAGGSTGGAFVEPTEQSTDTDSPETITDFEEHATSGPMRLAPAAAAHNTAAKSSAAAVVPARRAEHLAGFDRPVRHTIDSLFKIGGSSSPKVTFACP